MKCCVINCAVRKETTTCWGESNYFVVLWFPEELVSTLKQVAVEFTFKILLPFNF